MKVFFLMSAVVSRLIPIRFNQYNQPIILNGTIPGLFRRELDGLRSSAFEINPIFSGNSRILCGTDDECDGTLLDGILLDDSFTLVPGIATEFVDRSGQTRVVSAGGYDTSVSVGVGRSSYLMAEYNTISVLRHVSSDRGLLILNDSDATQFNRSCVPESISQICYRSETTADTSIDVQYRLVYPANENGRGEEIVETPSSSTHLSIGNILTLPNAMAWAIYRTISESRAVRARGSQHVTNCDFAHLRELLPTITVNFIRTETALVLYPDDYISFNSHTNECTLRFDRQERDYERLFINPLALPGMNLHLTRTGLLICDSQ